MTLLSQLYAALEAAENERLEIQQASETRMADPEDTTEVRGAFVLGDDGEPTGEIDSLVGFTETEANRWGDLEKEIVSLRSRIARAEDLEQRSQNNSAISSVNVMVKRDPFDLSALSGASGHEIRSQAHNAIETLRSGDHVAECLAGAADKSANVAAHIIATSSDEYRSAAMSALAGRSLTQEQRATIDRVSAQTESRSAIGSAGIVVPATIDPALIINPKRRANPIREHANVQTVASGRFVKHTLTVGEAVWDGELEEVTEGTGTIASKTIDIDRASVNVQASWEALNDLPSLEHDLFVAMSRSRNRSEVKNFAVGDGVKKPQGLITGLQGLTPAVATVTAGTAAKVTKDDIPAMIDSLDEGYLGSARWLADSSTVGVMRGFKDGEVALYEPGYHLGSYDTLFGYPLHSSSAMPAIAAGAAPLFFGDLEETYTIVDRVGTVLLTTQMLGAGNRPVGGHNFTMFWWGGAGVVNPDAGRVLVV